MEPNIIFLEEIGDFIRHMFVSIKKNDFQPLGLASFCFLRATETIFSSILIYFLISSVYCWN